jgi:hypothetical protein
MAKAKKGDCCPGRCFGDSLFVITLALLLLVNLNVFTGGFADFVLIWWPVGLAFRALHGFCPCSGECKV